MQPDWDSKDNATNPFAPIDFTSRLQKPVQKRRAAAPQPPRPGQLYGGLSPMKPIDPLPTPEYWQVPLAPPGAWLGSIPSYLRRRADVPPASESSETPHQPDASGSQAACAPVSAESVSPARRRRRSHQSDAVSPQPPAWDSPEETVWQPPNPNPWNNLPDSGSLLDGIQPPAWGSLLNDAPAAGPLYANMQFDTPASQAEIPQTDEPVDEIAAFFAEDPEADQEPRFPDETGESFPVWKDAFAPAEQAEPEPLRDAYDPAPNPPQINQPARAAKPPVRVGRVLALVLAAVMLVFCAAVGVPTLIELSRNEKAVQTVKADYLEKTGQQLQSGASRVDLPPAGQTFEPTASPSPPPQLNTPTPEPLIPINEAAIADLNRQRETGDVQQETAAATDAPPLRTRETSYPDNPMLNVMDSLVTLRQEYPEAVGRLVIDGLLDEVVVQRDNMYYLTHNYQGALSPSGAVFMDEYCSLQMPPENLLLRGQSDVDGKTFGPLKRFVTEGPSFAGSYSLATLTTLYEESRYRLFAVLQTASDPAKADYFSYSSYPTFGSDTEMLNYVQQVKNRSLYNFNVDVDAGDRLLTLATVGSGDDCVILVYRRLRPGE